MAETTVGWVFTFAGQ